jgi:hypothetical protein
MQVIVRGSVPVPGPEVTLPRQTGPGRKFRSIRRMVLTVCAPHEWASSSHTLITTRDLPDPVVADAGFERQHIPKRSNRPPSSC